MSTSPELSADDRTQLAARGISEQELVRQLECLRRGFVALDLVGPATLDHGIESLEPSRRAAWHERWERAAREGRLSEFVPASGAASRMFKALEARRADRTPLDAGEIARARGSADPERRDVARFFDGFDRFAFAPALRAELGRRGLDADAVLAGDDLLPVLDAMLAADGLGYASLPKGLIPFHHDGSGARTAFEEQLDEALDVVCDEHGISRVHFTVAPEFRTRIEEHCARASRGHQLGFSEQSPSTDTVAADRSGQPFRDAKGRLVFRPGGHGALIDNLGALDADVVFVKNIDNVVPRARRAIVVEHQRLLAGVLLERLEAMHGWWRWVRDDRHDDGVLHGAMEFVTHALHRVPPAALARADAATRRAWLLDVLARPLRVCGMVRNEGEPGGGPYWVRDRDGVVALQIVEAVQIDRTDPAQDAHVRAATHFNPVDLVCALRGPEGGRHDLARFVDPDTGFVSTKSKDGVELLALERPGLWNGAMAHWNTVFVEVPVETFHPVKTVLDLLRPAHQPL